ncbi:MAG: class I SAM-dependent methyltransferase [Bdellovibrionales bacterium]|nr:class I SAM-dependent methyltransferase [Bdellovibrionales bacterium]
MISEEHKLAATLPSSHVSSLKRIESGYWWYVGRVRWATRLISPWAKQQPRPLLYADLGCGTGGFAASVHSKFDFDRVALVDGDPAMLAEAPQQSPFESYHRNLQAPFGLPFQPQLISCMDVIEHLEDDRSFVKAIAAMLPRGGKLIASVPAHQWLFSEWDRVLGHYRRYDKTTLKKVFEEAGLRIETAAYMWSALVPLGLLRKRQFKKGAQAEFPKVSAPVNFALTLYSDLEWRASQAIPTPFGTSLIVSAKKP